MSKIIVMFSFKKSRFFYVKQKEKGEPNYALHNIKKDHNLTCKTNLLSHEVVYCIYFLARNIATYFPPTSFQNCLWVKTK